MSKKTERDPYQLKFGLSIVALCFGIIIFKYIVPSLENTEHNTQINITQELNSNSRDKYTKYQRKLTSYLTKSNITDTEIKSLVNHISSNTAQNTHFLATKNEKSTSIKPEPYHLNLYTEIDDIVFNKDFVQIEERLIKTKEKLEEFIESADAKPHSYLEQSNKSS